MTLRLKANRRFPSIPVVVDDARNHTQVLMAVKEALDIGQRRTGDLFNSFIRVQDLIDLGLITIEGNTNAIVGADLSEIADIGDLSGAAADDFLRFNGSEWVNDSLHTGDITQSMVTQHEAALSIDYTQLTGTPTFELDDIADVDAPAPTDGDVLTWNAGSSEWIAAAPTGGGGSQYLDDLLDVEAPYPNVGDVLTWDGYGWVNEAPTIPTTYITELDTPPVSPDAMDDEFDDENFDLTKWTWDNQGGATIQEDSSSLGHAILTTPGAGSDNYRFLYQTLPMGNWKFRSKMLVQMTDANFAQAGIGVRNSGNGRLYAFGPLYASGQGMYVQAMTSYSAYSASPLAQSNRPFNNYYYLEIEYNGTNLIFRYQQVVQPWSPFSFSAGVFTVGLTVAPASFLLGNPDQIGMLATTANGQPCAGYYDWFRRIS